MGNNNLVVFDLDGTLNITHLFSVPAQRRALAEFCQTEYPDDALLRCLGERGCDYARRLLPNRTEEDYALFLRREFFWEQRFMPDHAAAFPGTAEMLRELRRAGVRTAVCSNAPVEYITAVLHCLGLAELIDALQPLLPNLTKVDTLALLLEREKPQKALMVGDRIFDMEAARGNHLPFIGCLYGFNPDEIRTADYCAQTPLDVLVGVAQLFA